MLFPGLPDGAPFHFMRGQIMEVQAIEAFAPARHEGGDDAVLWILHLWGFSLVIAFLAGALCWRQCGSRHCHRKIGRGEQDPEDENLDKISPLKSPLRLSPPSSRVRPSNSPTRRRSSYSTSRSSHSSRSSRPKGSSNKQPRNQRRGDQGAAPEGIRGRPSATERGKAAWKVMESMMTSAAESPWKNEKD